MNTAHGVIGFGSQGQIKGTRLRLVQGIWTALQERRKREKLLADLTYLNDFELKDIGITSGEIDYVVSNRSIDPRGVRSAGSMNV